MRSGATQSQMRNAKFETRNELAQILASLSLTHYSLNSQKSRLLCAKGAGA